MVHAIIARNETTEEQLKTLGTIVTALVKQTKRPLPLLVALAEIQFALDRFQDAEKIYREILAREPENYMVCNNLAEILALQKTRLDEALGLINKAIDTVGPLGRSWIRGPSCGSPGTNPKRPWKTWRRPWPKRSRRGDSSTRLGPTMKTEISIRPKSRCKRRGTMPIASTT